MIRCSSVSTRNIRPGWSRPLRTMRGGVEVEDADLGGEHDEAVVGDPVAARAQAVAVEHRADLGAVGEDHAGGAVPRLHQRGVELVERAALRVHLLVVLPGLRDHHQHRVGQRAAAHVEQLEDLVEARRVGGARRTDREQPVEVARDQVGGEQRLAGPHPVAVAHHGVDLAVVGDEAERVGQRPAREGVGREARVHDGQRGGDPLVGEVGEEAVELVGGEHALVEQGARATATGSRPRSRARRACAGRRRSRSSAIPVDAAAGAGHEELAERRHHAAGGRAERRRGRPARRASRGRSGPPRRRAPRSGAGSWRPPRRRPAGTPCRRRTRAAPGSSKSTTARRNASGTCSRMPAPSPEFDLGAGGAAVVEVAQGGQRLGHDVVAGHAGEGRDERHATRVVLVAGVVEPLGGRASMQAVRLGAHRPVLPSSVPRPLRRAVVAGRARQGGRGRRWPKRGQASKQQRT